MSLAITEIAMVGIYLITAGQMDELLYEISFPTLDPFNITQVTLASLH
jgi:hypothetical protein